MPVSQISDLLSGLENGADAVALGASTITPERLARVDFSYPTHRSGVVAVFARRTGAASAFSDYGEAVGELGLLILAIVILLTVIGVLMWWFERAHLNKTGKSASESSVTSWHDGLYWADHGRLWRQDAENTPRPHSRRRLDGGKPRPG